MRVFAPGKLVITGAYAVLEGAPAGGVEIAPQASVTGGVPAGQITDPESDELTVILEDLSDQVRPGLTVPAMFVFENAGEVRVDVPVDAGNLAFVTGTDR